MSQIQILEGTGKELQRMLEKFSNERFRLIPLPSTHAENESNEITAEAGSLYDLLGEYVASVEGNGESAAARFSGLFTE